MHAGAEVIVRWVKGEERGNALGLHPHPNTQVLGHSDGKEGVPRFFIKNYFGHRCP